MVQAVDNGGVWDCHPFGFAGGTGSIENVCHVGFGKFSEGFDLVLVLVLILIVIAVIPVNPFLFYNLQEYQYLL